jgi:hypothetical protein
MKIKSIDAKDAMEKLRTPTGVTENAAQQIPANF